MLAEASSGEVRRTHRKQRRRRDAEGAIHQRTSCPTGPLCKFVEEVIEDPFPCETEAITQKDSFKVAPAVAERRIRPGEVLMIGESEDENEEDDDGGMLSDDYDWDTETADDCGIDADDYVLNMEVKDILMGEGGRLNDSMSSSLEMAEDSDPVGDLEEEEV